MFENLLKNTCKHDKLSPHLSAGYCPDCGEHVENQWHLTRCSCCGMKTKSILSFGKVKPIIKFCKNCGSSSFESEKLDFIDIVNINYATVVKKVVRHRRTSVIESWMEDNFSLKLLPSFV